MRQHLALTSLLVERYDEAIDFFVNKLGFELVEDSPTMQSANPTQPKRWVVVAPSGSTGSGLLLAEASDESQRQRIGDQTGGRVFLFLYTDDFWRDYELYKSRGVEFVRGTPREEDYGTVAVFRDISGNLWDLIEPAAVDQTRNPQAIS
ncbi:MAG: VOC family protein [Gammaproteobacteria bacterium]|nr:VOC family protein [Gammaproteobacteria bacterium]